MSTLIRRTLLQVLPALAVGALSAPAASAQSIARLAAPREVLAPAAAPARTGWRAVFGPGERADYEVRLGGRGVGSGAMEVLGTESVDGHQTYHTVLRVKGGLLLARVNDRFESWIDVNGLFSRRFKKDQHELTARRHKEYDFFPELRTWRRTDNDEIGTLATNEPLDDVSFLVHARSLPLVVGETYTLRRYFKDDRPVTIKVLRKEHVKVPAGEFDTIVVQPVLQAGGLFGEGGKAEVYFSDDSRRVLVQLKSRVPVLGSLSLHLKGYQPAQQ